MELARNPVLIHQTVNSFLPMYFPLSAYEKI